MQEKYVVTSAGNRERIRWAMLCRTASYLTRPRPLMGDALKDEVGGTFQDGSIYQIVPEIESWDGLEVAFQLSVEGHFTPIYGCTGAVAMTTDALHGVTALCRPIPGKPGRVEVKIPELIEQCGCEKPVARACGRCVECGGLTPRWFTRPPPYAKYVAAGLAAAAAGASAAWYLLQ